MATDAADGRASRWNRILHAFGGAHTAEPVDMDTRLSRARFRAWHRGTREADYMIGSFFDHHHRNWEEEQLAWFEALLEEDDVDVMGWALRAQAVPDRLAGPQMTALQRLDYVKA
jgi:antitoxin CptB